jgi:predicted GIY-YIG superfamily endonuclease
MAQQGTMDWKGKSGRTYPFEIWTKNTQFYEVECIYIYTKLENDGWQCLYVGQTSQLATRLQQHANGDSDSDKCIQKSGATHIHVHQKSPESARFDEETDIRNNYRWSCNKQ